MGTNRKYWKGLEELNETPAFVERKNQEFPTDITVQEFVEKEGIGEASTDRRDFLKFLGFSVAAATLAACEAPMVKSIPYVFKPEDVTPGVANWYASTYYDGSTYASILFKTREGRPIFVKGNKNEGITKGGVNSQVVGSVLSLYNNARLQNPQKGGSDTDWKTIDAAAAKALAKSGRKVVLTNTQISPSANMLINGMDGEGMAFEGLKQKFGVEHVQYDAVSYEGIRKAYEKTTGKAIIPDYKFAEAKVIVSVGADFLGGWLLDTEYQGAYASRRNPDGKWMSRHYQFESNMSVAGSNADYRGMITPAQEGAVLSTLLKELGGAGKAAQLDETVMGLVKKAAKDLKSAKGASLVVSGSNDENIQIVVAAINELLGNHGKTVDVNNDVRLYNGSNADVQQLIKDMNAKKVATLIIEGTNPAYSLNGFADAMKNVENVFAFSEYADETASRAKYVATVTNYLEQWNDFKPKANHYALAQPGIRPMYNTAPFGETLLVWLGMAERQGKESTQWHDFIKSTWVSYGYNEAMPYDSAEDYWNHMVHSSGGDFPMGASEAVTFDGSVVSGAANAAASTKGGAQQVQLYVSGHMGLGQQAANPWLQETPDSITKVTWDNFVTINPKEAEELGLPVIYGEESPAGLVKVTANGVTVELPAIAQPGQKRGTYGIALGYGRGEGGLNIGNGAFQNGERGKLVTDENGVAKPIGANAFRMMANGSLTIASATIEATGSTYPIAMTQTSHTVMGRHSIVKETTLATFKAGDKNAYNKPHTLAAHEDGKTVQKPISEFDLWDAHPVENIGHRWGMSIDLNSCIGCGSCLVACVAENNVPVVGKDEVRRGREMHWLRIDRYYSSDLEETVGERKEGVGFGNTDLEIPEENPKVVYMPMMCHHCNHAPCETVCPVAATTHSNEGLNQMTYNRCIGTRYCANNCPYKVRRFNWFNYPSYQKFSEVNPAQDDLGRMVLNPDVVVRTRGVMEKCSFCVQRIQTGKLDAKKEMRPVADGEVQTACSDACPTNAITFGDWNDTQSLIRKVADGDRAYQALEEVGVKPNVWYQTKVTNEEAVAKKVEEVAHTEENNH